MLEKQQNLGPAQRRSTDVKEIPVDLFGTAASFGWRVRISSSRVGGDVGVGSPRRTSKGKMHQVSRHVFKFALHCSVMSTAGLALLCCAAADCSGDTPRLQCCVIRILTKGTCVVADGFSTLLRLLFF